MQSNLLLVALVIAISGCLSDHDFKTSQDPTPLFLTPGGALWRPYYKVKITNQFSRLPIKNNLKGLKELQKNIENEKSFEQAFATESRIRNGSFRLIADEVELDSDFYTEGNPVQIQAGLIKFNGKSIKTYIHPADTLASGKPRHREAPAQGKAKNGVMNGLLTPEQLRAIVAPFFNKQFPGFSGDHGKPGKTGHPGSYLVSIKGKRQVLYTGVEGDQHPGSIKVFACNYLGKPSIAAIGQQGGRGPDGGDGGEGGDGYHGGRAIENHWPFPDTKAGQGGNAGRGGDGGHGGKGGQGGPNPNVTFLTAKSGFRINDQDITIAGGQGGLEGDGGYPGAAGKVGPGGAGDSAWNFPWIVSHQDPGKDGNNSTPGNLGKPGTRGETGLTSGQPEVYRLYNINKTYKKTLSAWFDFHISRMFYYLAKESFRLIQDQENILNENSDKTDKKENWLDLEDEIQKQRMVQIRLSWKRYWTKPIKKFFDRIPKYSIFSSRIISLNRLASKIQSLLKSSDISDFFETKDHIFNSSVEVLKKDLKMALHFCEILTQEKQKKINDSEDKTFWTAILGSTDYYSIPACLGKPDFSRADNLFKTILLSHVNKGSNFIEKSDKIFTPLFQVIDPKDAIKVGSLFEYFPSLFSTAHAQERHKGYEIIFIKDKPLNLTLLRRGVLGSKVSNSNGRIVDFGVIVGFQTPKSLNLDQLSYQLKILSLQLEMQNEIH